MTGRERELLFNALRRAHREGYLDGTRYFELAFIPADIIDVDGWDCTVTDEDGIEYYGNSASASIAVFAALELANSPPQP